MTEHEEVMEALRKLWAKLVEIEHRLPAPKQAALKLPGSAKKKPMKPEWTLLRGRLMAAWQTAKGNIYGFDGRDAKGVSNLLKRGKTVDEVVAVWNVALKGNCPSIYFLDVNFNQYSAVPSTRTQVEAGADLYAEKR